ncbi:MAG TPA: substrate-binding domain-containing protein [Cytophagaceae bacterium]|nr:substrate-binding domain-containing protein [Cytophagaceae bacterium]
MTRFFYSFLFVFIAVIACAGILFSCSSSSVEQEGNTHTSGHMRLLADETFSPLLGTTVETFEAIYPKASIELSYQPQEQAIRELLEGKADVAIVGRKLTKAEEEKIIKSKGLQPKTNQIASDALVFISSKENKDTLLSEAALLAMLSGKTKRTLVCDKNNSGNIIYLQQRFGQSGEMHNLAAAGSDSAVIEYVANHPQALGIIGMSLVSNYKDPKVMARLEKINLMTIQYQDSTGKSQYGYPVQEELITGKYPFIRGIFILNLDGQKNLGTGFANFIAGERGQRIVLKAGLMPFRMPTREIIIN